MSIPAIPIQQQPTINRMSFVEHLDVLRVHIIRCVVAVLVCSFGVFIYRDWIFDNLITAPLSPQFFTYIQFCKLGNLIGAADSFCITPTAVTLQTTTFGGQFLSSISIAIYGGLIVSLPYVFWELWRFVKPALKANELKGTNHIIFWISCCFFAGAAFAYFLLAPFTFNFLNSFQLGQQHVLVTKPTLTDYLDNLTNLIVGCGVAFEMPVIAFLLTKIGLLSKQWLQKYRKYAVLVMLLVAAIITPSPDWLSQLIVFLPLYFLYEISIVVSARTKQYTVA